MKALSSKAHAPEVEARRTITRLHRNAELTAQEHQRGRLRDSTLLRRNKKEKRVEQEGDPDEERPKKRQRLHAFPPPQPTTLHHALERRLEAPEPALKDYKGWTKYREESILLLQHYMPNTPLAEVSKWISANSVKDGRILNAAKILYLLRLQYPTMEVHSLEDMRLLMKCLSIRWSKVRYV